MRTVGSYSLPKLFERSRFRNLVNDSSPFGCGTDRGQVRAPDSYCRIMECWNSIQRVQSGVGANIIQTIDSVDKNWLCYKKEYGPLGAKFQKIYDQSNYIRDAVEIVKRSLIEAIILACCMFVFLKRWRSYLSLLRHPSVFHCGTFISACMRSAIPSIVLSLPGLLVNRYGRGRCYCCLGDIYLLSHRYEEGKNIVRRV